MKKKPRRPGRFLSYAIKCWRTIEGGFRAAAFVGPKRDILAAVSRCYWGREGAEQAVINLMRSKHQRDRWNWKKSG